MRLRRGGEPVCGVSLIELGESGRIRSLKEFQSKAEHCFPYGERETENASNPNTFLR
ncbi:MAG: hypothetical protein LLF75_12910 [Eubacteriales bacterium]|nr:hypothetical protein [Eubacteriales bacterium]